MPEQKSPFPLSFGSSETENLLFKNKNFVAITNSLPDFEYNKIFLFFSLQKTKTKFKTSREMTAHLFSLKIGANFFKNGNRIFDNWKVV